MSKEIQLALNLLEENKQLILNLFEENKKRIALLARVHNQDLAKIGGTFAHIFKSLETLENEVFDKPKVKTRKKK